MDILELKSINSKMLESTSSVQLTTTSKKEKRRSVKESFCEFDIIENYNLRKKHRKKLTPKQTDLGQKIHNLKTRNEEIEKIYNAEQIPKKNHKSRTLSRKRSSDSKYKSEKELTEQINKVAEIKQQLEQELLTRRHKTIILKTDESICHNCSGHVDKALEEEDKTHRRHRRRSKKTPKFTVEEVNDFKDKNPFCQEIRRIDIVENLLIPNVSNKEELLKCCLKTDKFEHNGKKIIEKEGCFKYDKQETLGFLKKEIDKQETIKKNEEVLSKVGHVSRKSMVDAEEVLKVENLRKIVKKEENMMDNFVRSRSDDILKLENDIKRSLKKEDKEEILKLENNLRKSLNREEREEIARLGKSEVKENRVETRRKMEGKKVQLHQDKILVEKEGEERVNIGKILKKNEEKALKVSKKRSLSSNKEHREVKERRRSLSRNRYIDDSTSRDKQIEFDEVLIREVENLDVKKSFILSKNSSEKIDTASENLKINRKELSFSNLNLAPIKNLYMNVHETVCVTTQTSTANVDLEKKISEGSVQSEVEDLCKKEVKEIKGKMEHSCKEGKETKGKISQTALALQDIFRASELEQIASIANKKPERRNYSEKSINKQDNCELKCRTPFVKSKFHTSKTIVPTERIVEISSKIFRDQKISFTVEGIEPAKKFSLNTDVAGNLRKNLNLNVKIFPGVDVKESDMQILSHGKNNVVTVQKVESSVSKKSEANSQISLKLRKYRMMRRIEQSLKRKKVKSKGKFVENSTQTIQEDVAVETVGLIDTLFIKDLRYDLTDSITQTSSKKSVAVEANLKINSSTSVCPKIDCVYCEKSKGLTERDLVSRQSKSESNIRFGETLKSCDIYNFQIQNSKSVNNLGINDYPRNKTEFVSRIPKLKKNVEVIKKDVSKTKSELSDKISLNKAYHTNEIIALEKCLNDILAKLCSTDILSINKVDKDVSEPKIKVLHQKKRKSKSAMRRKSPLSINKITRSKSTLSVKRGKKLRKKRCRKTSGDISESSNYVSSVFNSQSETMIKSVYKNDKSISSSTTICPKTSTPSYQKVSVSSLETLVKNKKNLKSTSSRRNGIDKRRSKDVFKDFRKVFKSKHVSTSLESLKDQCFPSVLLLSVSSCSVPLKRYKGVSKVRMKSDKGIISKEPFYIGQTSCSEGNKQSDDSLEPSQIPDICPLTNIFNYSPPSYAYYVYNSEIHYKKDKKEGSKSEDVSGRNLTSFSRTRASTNNSIFFHEVKAKPVLSPRFVEKKLSSPKIGVKEEMCTFSQVNECKTCKNLVVNFSPTNETKPDPMMYQTCLKYLEKCKPVSNCASTDSNATYKQLMSNESGYESCKSQKTNSIKNFFKKGGSLLDIFKTAKKKETPSKSSLKIIQENKHSSDSLEKESSDSLSVSASRTVLWFNFGKRKKELQELTKRVITSEGRKRHQECKAAKCEAACSTTTPPQKNAMCQCASLFEKQVSECQKYAEKVLLESAMRKEGYLKQYNDFKEIPLDVMLGKKKCSNKKCTCEKSPCKEEIAIQANPLSDMSLIALKSATIQSISEDLESIGTEGSKLTVEEKVVEEEVEEEEEPKKEVDFQDISVNDIDVDVDSLSLKHASGSKSSDREVFDKLLDRYEKSDSIARRLSLDDEFIEEQISAARSSLSMSDKLLTKSSHEMNAVIRDPRFSDKAPITLKKDDCTVEADDIGTCFARGFRPDNLLLSGDACFNLNKQDKIKMSPHMLKNTESIIDFSERETPLDFLLALGFMVDEASNALKDDDIRTRLLAAITEARVWINKITTTQGTLLYLVAYKARPETMRYFLQLVEAIINKRINNAIKLDGFLRVLEQVEDGRLQMINILGEDKFEEEENEEKIVKNQLKHLFVNVYSVAEKEAHERDQQLTKSQINLLRILVAKYRAGLHPHLELIARYIGQGLLYSEVQLEAAMIFLSRLDTAEVKLKEFENYCGIRCEVKEGKGLRMENFK